MMGVRTKFILTYIGGIVSGIVLTFAFLLTLGMAKNASSNDDIVMFEHPQGEIKIKSFDVMQVLPDGSALAMANDYLNYGTIVLFLAKDGSAYYDNQVIEVPAGMCVMQVGTYKYISRQEILKTVPVVEILRK